MSDIARLAGVSASTVSRALSGHPSIPVATREAIERIADENGYVIHRPAQTLRQSQTRTIAIAVPHAHERDQLVSDPFFLPLFGYIADQVSARGFDTLLVRGAEPESHWLKSLIRSGRADGVIVLGQSDQHEAIQLVAHDYAPIVVGGGRIPGQSYTTVGSDDAEGGRLAAEHLLRTGRRRLAFVGPANLPQIDQRFAGFAEGLRGQGLELERSLTLNVPFTGSLAFDRARKLLERRTDLDGVFAASDGLARSIIRAVEAVGRRCPDDVAVVGFDDSSLATQTSPTLTTIRQDIGKLARTLVDLLFERLAGEGTQMVTLPVQLVVRESAPD